MDPEMIQDSAQAAASTAIELVSNWGLQVVGAVAVLIIGRWFAGLVRRSAGRALERGKVDPSLRPIFQSTAYYIVLTNTVIAVMNLFGIQTTSLIAVVGAAGLAIGLALQGTLSNFAAGVMLLMFRPFKLGDYVEIGGSSGSVAEISAFTTTLNTPDNIVVMIPNADIYGQAIKNYSANELRRVDMVMGISYDDNIGTAIEVIERIVKADERVVADPETTVAVAELGDSSVNLVVRPWCKGTDYWGLKFDLTRALKEGLEAGGCSIPYPQRDVHLDNVSSAA
jgi:small conductance mechanosensitive channel